MTRKYSQPETIVEARRKLLKAVGGSALLVSASGLAACSGDNSASSEAPAAPPAPAPRPEPAAAPEPAPETAAPMAEESASQPAPAADPQQSGSMPRLDPSDPQAKALGYVADASGIDPAAEPRFKPGQACANCSLYVGQADGQWGPCSIFPGKLVNADGWCTVYSPKA